MEESSADAKWFSKPTLSFSNKEKPGEDTSQTVKQAAFDPNALYYDMSGDKYLIILNQHKFKRTQYFQYKQPTTRSGTENDVESLELLFNKLGFKVTTHTDLEYENIIKEIRYVCAMGHSRTSCICIAILTHGDSGDVYAADRPYRLKDIMAIFENHPNLINKPKLFFIQACRGDKTDSGKRVQLDGEASFTVPTHADFLTLYSTVEGEDWITLYPQLHDPFETTQLPEIFDYLSYRNSLGSFMIQSLCKIIEEHHENLDILHIITLVNRRVAYEYTTYSTSEEMNNKKQMPEARSPLSRKLNKMKNFVENRHVYRFSTKHHQDVVDPLSPTQRTRKRGTPQTCCLVDGWTERLAIMPEERATVQL